MYGANEKNFGCRMEYEMLRQSLKKQDGGRLHSDTGSTKEVKFYV